MTELEAVQAEFVQQVNACESVKLIAIKSGFALLETVFDTRALISLPRSWEGWQRRGGLLGVLEEVYDRANRQGRFNTERKSLSGLKTPKEIYRGWEDQERWDTQPNLEQEF